MPPREYYHPEFNPWLGCLRGIAVLLVLFFHTGTPGFQSGYLGVDIFFVLSGYLITQTLLKNNIRNRASFFEFYWKRFLRLFPALLIVSLTLYFVAPWLTISYAVSTDIIAALTYVANWTRVDWPHVPAYLAHTWSLSIEEQFYVLWPLVLTGLLCLGPRRQAALFAVLIALTSAVARAFASWSEASSERLYNSFDLRADGLLLGCALALYTFQDDHSVKTIKKIAGPALILLLPVFVYLLAFAPFDAWWMFRFGYFAAALATTAVLAVLLTDKPVRKRLYLAPILFIGEISYGMYLWHYPISLEMSNLGFSTFYKSTTVFVLSAILATASFYLIERPLASLRQARIGPTLGQTKFALTLCAFAGGVWFFWF